VRRAPFAIARSVIAVMALVAGVLGPPAQAAGTDTAAAGAVDDARRAEQRLRAELDEATSAFITARTAREDADDRLAVAERRAKDLAASLGQARATVNEQAANLYRTGGLGLIDTVLGSGPGDVASRMELLDVVKRRRDAELEEAALVIAQHARAVAEAKAARDESQAQLAAQEAAVARLAERFKAAQALTERIERIEAEQRAKAAAAAEARRRAEAAARARAAAAAAAARAPAPAPAPVRAPADPPAAAPPARPRGSVACPLAKPYSYIDSWGAARSGGRRHKGTDIMAPYGAKVFAYVSGRVRRAEATGGLGGIVIYLNGDDGNEYYYAHLSKLLVRAGQRVAVGELVARNGATGNAPANAPHVHFEVHPGGGAAVNPYPFVRRACG
jgi:murein DD-endopeptidase MepM/ murein hydrolase activator NlpD